MTITLTREEAQQVLDALELVTDLTNHDDELYEAIETLRARLSASEPPCKTGSQCIGGKCPQCVVTEPVGWIYEDDEGRMMFSQMPTSALFWEPVYKSKLWEKNSD